MQLQVSDVTNPESKPGRKQHHRVTPFPGRADSFRGVLYLFYLIPPPYSRESHPSLYERFRKALRQRDADISLEIKMSVIPAQCTELCFNPFRA